MHQDEVRMPDIAVTEEEIDAAEKFRDKGEFTIALALTQDMLRRVQNGDMRMRLLFDVLYCSTRLHLNDVTDDTISELEKLPEPKMARVFVNFIQAMSYIAEGKAQEGLDLIDANLKSVFMEKDDFQIWKYKHLAYKGSALIWLAQPDEALVSLAKAHVMYPDGVRETAILVDQANCLMALDRYEEAYKAASQVLSRGDEEMATLAMQYMAECRMWQSRVPEALKLYAAIQKRLPCRLVQEERIQTGIKNAMAYLEKLHPQGKPS
jgi:tetratricopeptide (TPR) repeat protein